MKKAFTLAEVLITLAIVGIVAAITIPSVIANYQQKEFKTGLRKAVSVLNEAIQANITQEGETPYENGDLYTYLQKHMNIIKATNLTACSWWRTYGGYVNCRQAKKTNSAFYTVDGMRFEIPNNTRDGSYGNLRMYESGEQLGSCMQWSHYIGNFYCRIRGIQSAHCGSYGLGTDPNKTGTSPCLVVVDVNGDRGPNSATDTKNSYGYSGSFQRSYVDDYTFPLPSDNLIQDIFSIIITEDRAIPFGVVAQRTMYEK